MRIIRIFKSKSAGKLYGFTEFDDAKKLPSDKGPWLPTGKTIELPVRKPGLIGLNPEELEASINKHGFHLQELEIQTSVSE